MRILLIPLCFPFCFLLVSCGIAGELKGKVPEMVLYSIKQEASEVAKTKAPTSLEVQYFSADSEHRSNLIRIYKSGSDGVGVSSYPENERWIGLPTQILTEKVQTRFMEKYSNVYPYPAPVAGVNYQLNGQIKRFEEVREKGKAVARIKVVIYFTNVESSEITGPFICEHGESFTADDKSALNLVKAMKTCSLNVANQIVKTFESQILETSQ